MPKNGQNWESSQRPNNGSADFPGPAALASVTQVRGPRGCVVGSSEFPGSLSWMRGHFSTPYPSASDPLDARVPACS